jgi:pimeloyl-ACP methyl ester carboxylesterase
MKLWVILSTLFASACCTSMPRVAPKRMALPALSPEYAHVAETSEVWRDERRDRDVPVKIYSPANARERLPVVVFSHGIGEDRDSYAWLGRAIAGHGFVTVHVTHAGTDRAVLERGYRHLYRAVKQPVNWINRPLDVSFVLDRLATRADADVNRTAAAGHSAGAFTSFALAGMLSGRGESLRDERVKVAIPMSMPRMDGVVPPGGYDPIGIPLLNMTGTCDTSLIYRTFPRHRRIPFEMWRAAAPECADSGCARQYLVTIARATHDSFVLEDERRDAIVALTVAFLRAHLRGDAASRAWFDEAGGGEIAGTAISVERKSRGAR